MQSIFTIVVLSLFCVTLGDKKANLPSYIQRCDFNDEKLTECVREQISASLPHFTKGIPELNVPSIDPVQLDDIRIDGNGLKLTFTEASMHGLSNSELIDFKYKLYTYESQVLCHRFESLPGGLVLRRTGKKLSKFFLPLHFHCNDLERVIIHIRATIGENDEDFSLTIKGNMSLIAKYEIDGRILILPIKGKGDAIVDTQGVQVQIKSKLIHVKKSNGEHFKLVTPIYKYDIEKTIFDLKNLFSGNKQLADTTLEFANQNWRQLMDDLAPPAIKQIVVTVVKTINKFFGSVPISQMIIGYKDKA